MANNREKYFKEMNLEGDGCVKSHISITYPLWKKYGEKISGSKVDVGALREENREKARRIFPESLQPLGIPETRDVLKLGIRTEERSIELYSTSAQKTDNELVKELFLKLSEIEKMHKSSLEDAMYYFEQDGSWYGYNPPTLEG